MNHSLFRYCCTAITLAALMLGTFIPLWGGVQAQETDGPELFVTAGSTVFALATSPGLGAQPQRLVSFEANTPGTLRSDVRIQGLQPGETLKGIDFRPANGQLYGLGSSSRLYTINFSTGVATPVGGAFTSTINSADFFGVDFNPVPDRLRVVSAVNDQNLRLNPNDGTTAGTDTNVAYAAGDVNTGDQPNIVGAAYTNNFTGATATTLYGIDARSSGGFARLVTIGGVDGTPSPNGGELRTVGDTTGNTNRNVGNLRTPAGTDLQTNNQVGFDITSGGIAYVSLTPINPFDAPSSLYTVDLATRTATAVGVIGRESTPTGGLKIEGIAVVTTAANQTNSTFQVSATTSTVAESTLSVNVTVTRTGITTAAASVDYTTVEGTASERMDYITAAGTLFFAAGETSQTVNILIQNDAFQEGTETFSFAISNPDGGTFANTGRSATITITDDDTTAVTTNPIDTRDFFVRQQYRDFLNRDPDAPGFAFWTGEYDRRVNACNTVPAGQQRINCVASARASISLAFFLSVEFQQTGYLVYRTYDVAFARVGTPRPARGQPVAAVAVTYNEFIRDTQTIARGIIVNDALDQTRLEANRQAYFRDFVQRADFTDRFPVEQSASQYVDALFASANISPTPTERQAALTAFGGGGIEGRASALRNVAENDQVFQREFNRAFVLLLYVGYLRRDPDIPGYNFWLNRLDAASTSTRIDPANVPNDAEAIGRVRQSEEIEAFIRSCEYQRRFGIPTTSPNERPVNLECADPTSPRAAFAVTSGNFLVRFNNLTGSGVGAPASATAITGLQTGETLVGIDFRPANGQLYGVGSNSRIYTINTTTGAATFVSMLSTTLDGTSFGVDFNPVPDRLRVVSNTRQNLRINVDTGATIVDGQLTPSTGATTTDPNIAGAAYTNPFAGATSTTLYDIDFFRDRLVIQNPPNDGTLVRVGELGVDTNDQVSFDIDGFNTAYALLTVGGTTPVVNLYTINLTSGAATLVGAVNFGTATGQLRGFAIAPAPALTR